MPRGIPKVPRKNSGPRPTKGLQTRAAASEALKRLWADPEWREQMTAKIRAGSRKWIGVPRRLGIPDGMRKAEAEAQWAECVATAKVAIQKMKDKGMIEDIDPRSEEALEYAMATVRSGKQERERLAAAKLVLEYTRPKPVAKQHITIDAAEAWLNAVANDEELEVDTAEDAEASA